MNWLRRTGLLALVTVLVLALGATSVSAATISEVVDELSSSGLYIDRNVSITEAEAIDIINHADDRGSRLYLAVLSDTPLGGSQSFAESILDDLNVAFGTVLVLSPEDVGASSVDEFSNAELEAALDYADDVAVTDGEYAAAFAVGLVGAAEEAAVSATTVPAETPTATPAQTSSSSSGGGGSGIFIFLLIVGGIGLLLFFLVRRGKKQTVNAAAQQMAEARGVVQKQVDAVANDILDMEDEVRVANNDEVDSFYNQASATYRTVTDRLQKADSPQDLVDLSNDLDIAIWQLDCAEALLDGKPKPSRPERKRLEPEPTAPSGQDRVTVPAPRTDYQRRPGRRSSYGGPGVMEILIGVAGQVLAGGGRGRSGGLGGMFGGRSATRRTPTSGASGGTRGGVVPGPGSPVQRSSSSSRSTRSTRSSRRTSTRRARRPGGGKSSAGRKRRRK